MPLLIECDRNNAGVGIDRSRGEFWGFRLWWFAIHWMSRRALTVLGIVTRDEEVIDAPVSNPSPR